MEKRGLVIAIVVLALILGGAYGAYQALSSSDVLNTCSDSTLAGSSSAAASAGSAQQAPLGTSIVDADGEEVMLADAIGGKPAIVNFWATWCPYCIDEMDDYQKLYDTFGDKVAFIMLDAVDGQRETAEKGKAYIKKSGLTFPVYFDTDARSAVSAFDITAFPTTFVLDADGGVVQYTPGRIDYDKVYSALASLVR